MSRLNRKRKTSSEREANKERSKRICLERSAAKTLLTLDQQTGKSKEELEAATTLLDLTVEPVINLGEPGEGSMHEFELEFEEPATAEFTEPIESQTNIGTQVRETVTKNEYSSLAVYAFFSHNIINKLSCSVCLTLDRLQVRTS